MSSWQNIPNTVIDQERRRLDAEAWESEQRAQLAAEWAERQRAETRTWLQQASPPYAPIGQLTEFQPQALRATSAQTRLEEQRAADKARADERWQFYTEPQNPVGRILGGLGARLEEEAESISHPFAGLILPQGQFDVNARLAGEEAVDVKGEALKAYEAAGGGVEGLQAYWRALGEGYRANTPEEERYRGEMLDPLMLATPAEALGLGRGAVAGLRSVVPEAKTVARGAVAGLRSVVPEAKTVARGAVQAGREGLEAAAPVARRLATEEAGALKLTPFQEFARGIGATKSQAFGNELRFATEPPDSVIAKIAMGDEEVIGRVNDVSRFTSPRGREYTFDLVKTRAQDGRRRYLVTYGGSDQVAAAALVDTNGKLAAIKAEESGIGLGQLLLRNIEQDFGVIEPVGPISQAGAKLLHRYQIAKALDAGEQVPANVLAEYPDLAVRKTAPVAEASAHMRPGLVPAQSGLSPNRVPSGVGGVAEAVPSLQGKGASTIGGGTGLSQESIELAPQPQTQRLARQGAQGLVSSPQAGEIAPQLVPPQRTPGSAGLASQPPSGSGKSIIPPSKQGGAGNLPEESRASQVKDYLREFWMRSRDVIAEEGPAGQKLATRVYNWRENYQKTAGKWMLNMPTVRKLGKMEFDNFVDVVEGKAVASSPTVQKAADEWIAVREDIWNQANAAMAVVGKQADYFPRRYSDRNFKGAGREKAIQHLIATGQAKDVTAAEVLLNNTRDVMRSRRLGNLAHARTADLPDYDRTKEVLFNYVYRAAKDISQMQQFGKGDQKAMRLLRTMGKGGHDRDAAENAFNIAVGAKKYGEKQEAISKKLRLFNVITKMGLGVISNATQPTNTATVIGPLKTLFASHKAAFSQEAKDFALECGVTVDGALMDLREGIGWTGGVGKAVVAPLFNPVEKFNRTLSAVGGREYAQMLAQKAAQGEQWAIDGLNAMRLNGADIAKRGTLTRDEEITAGRNMVERTQFLVDAQDLPGWADSPWGKLVMQFRSFAYNQTAFLNREILQPALKGNTKPLLTFLLLGLPVGAASTELRNFIAWRPSEEDPVQRIRQYYQRIGGIGVLGDVLGGIAPPNTKYLPGERYALQVAGTAFGPSMGTFLEGAGSVATALQGKPEGIERWALKQIPVVGPTLKNIVLPYKQGGRSGTGASSGGRGNLTDSARNGATSTGRGSLQHTQR